MDLSSWYKNGGHLPEEDTSVPVEKLRNFAAGGMAKAAKLMKLSGKHLDESAKSIHSSEEFQQKMAGGGVAKKVKNLVRLMEQGKAVGKVSDDIQGLLEATRPLTLAERKYLAEIAAKQAEDVAPKVKPVAPKIKKKEQKAEAAPSAFQQEIEAKKSALQEGREKFLSPSNIKDRLYHATPKDFKEFQGEGFDPTISGHATWLGYDPEYQPAMHNILGRKGAPFREGVNVMPVHVQARSPLMLDDRGMIDWAREVFAGGSAEFPHLMPKEWVEAVKDAGYDSIVFAPPGSAKSHQEVIMLDPKRIKSAIGNQGTYDIEQGDITKAHGGSVQNFQVGGVAKKAAKALGAAKVVKRASDDIQSLIEAGRPLTALEKKYIAEMAEKHGITLPADMTVNKGLQKPSEAFGKHEGKTAMYTQADRTKVGGGFLGGPGFSGLQLEYPAYKEAEAAWGVAHPAVAKTIVGSNARVPEGQAIWMPMLGHPEQHRSNQMVFDQIFNQFRREAKKGNLDDELRQKINDRLASAVDKDGNPLFPPDVDIMNKNFRQLANTFDRRAIAADVIAGKGVGGKKGSIIDYPKIIQSTTDPAVVDAPTGAVGHRAFTLTGDIGFHPELHPAFPYILRGEDLGLTYTPIPKEIAFRDFIEKVRQEKGRDPGYMDFTRGYAPQQFISEDWLTTLQKAGFAKGGEVRMGGGGNPGDVSGDMFAPKPLQIPSVITDAINAIRSQYAKEKKSLQKPGAASDIALRGPVATMMGAPADTLEMGANIVDYAQKKIPALRKPASVMDTEPTRTPQMGYAPRFPLSPEGEMPYGTEAAQKLMQRAGLTTGEERPLFELGATVVSPLAAYAAFKGAKAAAPTIAEELTAITGKYGVDPRMYAVPPEGKAGKIKAPANEIGFYNPAEKAALNLQRKKGAGNAFVSDLKKQPGVNDERLAEIGLGDLSNKPQMTKEEIISAAEQNRIPLRETVRRDNPEADRIKFELDQAKDELQYLDSDSYDYASTERLINDLERKYKQVAGEGKPLFGPENYPDASMPGGENYREIRIGIPEKTAPATDMSGYTVRTLEENPYTGQRNIEIIDPQGRPFATRVGFRGTDEQAIADEAKYFEKTSDRENNFYHKTHHGDEPNVLMHLRVADHVDAEGKKGLLIDELQSDWHQQGREKGYGPKFEENYRAYYTTPDGKQVDIAFAKSQKQLEKDIEESGWKNFGVDIKTEVKRNKVGQGVPEAPFKDNWYQLGLKRAIKEAADTGMDRLYLTTGARQNERYSLSHHVDSLQYDPKTQTLDGWKDGNLVISKTVLKDELPETIGKEASAKLLKTEPSAGKKNNKHELSGIDLDVGGAGMEQWYDKNYKNYLDKYAKQFGARVGETYLPKAGKGMSDLTSKEIDEITSMPGFIQEMMKLSGGKTAFQMSDSQYRSIFNQVLNKFRPDLGEKVYYIDITPQMKESAAKGQSYKRGGQVKKNNGLSDWFKSGGHLPR